MRRGELQLLGVEGTKWELLIWGQIDTSFNSVSPILAEAGGRGNGPQL